MFRNTTARPQPWRRIVTISIGLIGLMMLGASVAGPVDVNAEAGAPTSTILVQFQSQASPQAIAALNASMATEEVDALPALGIRVLRVPPGQDPATVAARYGRNPLVNFAEVNALVAPEEVPDDPYFGNAWHLAKIETAQAWDTIHATGVLIGICDTGFEASHPDLGAILRGDLGWNSADGSNDWSPIAAHGTYVAGAAAAATNNATGVAGVAWGAQVIPVRITNSTTGSAYVSDAAKCIQYAADHGARSINLSYRMAGYASIDTAAAYARDRGALTFVAAGNDGTDPGWPNYPNFMAVAASTSTDGRPSWSNYGDFVDIAAPGTSIWTTRADATYGTISGTSMASPVAAGVAALVAAANPALGPGDVEAILRQTAEDIGDPGNDPYFGDGRVNASRAVLAATGGSTTPPPSDPEPEPEPAPDSTAPVAGISDPGDDETVAGTVSVSVSATDDTGVTRVELYIDGALAGSMTSAPYTFTWDTTAAGDGERTISALAYDAAGNVGQSAPVSVNVANAMPEEPIVETFSGSVGGNGKKATTSASHVVTVTASGPMTVGLTWGGKGKLTFDVLDASGASLIDGATTAALEAETGSYTVVVTAESGRGNYTLTVSHW